MNYVFEGCRPGDPEGEVVVGCLGGLKADHRRADSPDKIHPATSPIKDLPLNPTLGH